MILKIHISLLFALLYNLYISKKSIFFIAYMFIVMHELSHIIIALLLNVDIEEIVLLPFGATAKYKGGISLKQELLIAIAGPLASLFFAFIYNNDIYYKINLLIIFINLIPIYPLDGGRILRVLLTYLLKEKKSIKISNYISILFVSILICFSIYMIFEYKNYTFLLFSIYILKNAKEQTKKEKLQDLINYLQIEK